MLFDRKHCWQCFPAIFRWINAQTIVLKLLQRVAKSTSTVVWENHEDVHCVELLQSRTPKHSGWSSTQWLELRLDVHCLLLPQEAATSVRATRYKCLHENIAGKHCQQCFLSNSTAPGDPARRQMPSAKKNHFLYTFANIAPEIAQSQNQTQMSCTKYMHKGGARRKC